MADGARDAGVRPSPWRTRFAYRAYASSALLLAALVVDWLSQPAGEPGWLAIRLDPAGLSYAASALTGGANFFGAGLRAARTLRLDMNFLMSAAIVAAILIGEPFEAATLAALFSLAELLERFAVDRARRSIGALLALAPEQAQRLRADGTTEAVPAASLATGDRIRVRPGDRIGADGRVIAGTSAVDEAAVTGESVPVVKRPGDRVFSGTRNTEGALDIEVTVDAEHSVLARIVALVRTAEARRAPIEHFVQRFARVYTPAVTALAALVIVVPPLAGPGDPREWFLRGITLLVIACPCALVIATPVTVVSALTSAARHGVLIKGGEHLERLGSVRALATDKTGTLTRGALAVTSFESRPASAARRMLDLVAAVEARSEHPVGRALLRYAAEHGARGAVSLVDFRSQPGRGVVARADGAEIALGTEDLVGREPAAGWTARSPGAMEVFATTSDGAAARFTLADEARPEAVRFIRELHELDVRPIVLLTGDRAGPADAIARAAGVDVVRPELMPEEKVEAIRELRAAHGAVAMVGDGVNDAPALAEADVGIAMGAAGSPAAIETADVALMSDDLSRVPYAVSLARAARRTVRFNIAVALSLKLVLAVGAVLGHVSLAVAVLVGDMGGSLLVTANALLLAHRRPSRPNDEHGAAQTARRPIVAAAT